MRCAIVDGKPVHLDPVGDECVGLLEDLRAALAAEDDGEGAGGLLVGQLAGGGARAAKCGAPTRQCCHLAHSRKQSGNLLAVSACKNTWHNSPAQEEKRLATLLGGRVAN